MKIFKRLSILSLLVFTIASLSGCQEQEVLKVITPYGSPSYATLYLNGMSNYDVDTVYGPDPLVAAFGSDTYDVIVAPTNLGAKFYQSSKDYQLIASIVWGNYYLISGQDITIDNLNDVTIYTFGQNQTPDIVLKYVMSELNITPNYVYLSSSVEISTQFILSPNDVYLIAEPDLSQLSEDINHIYQVNIQTYYENVTGDDAYPQASVFAKTTLSDHVIQQLRVDLESSISSINDIDHISQTAQLLSSDLSQLQLENSIIRSNLCYMSAADARSSIETYFNIILNQNPVLIGNVLPESDFYR